MIDNYILKDFGKILKTNHQSVRTLHNKGTNVMRVYDKALEALKLTIDIYADYVVACDYSENGFDELDLEKLINTIASNLYIAKSKIIYKHKKKGEEFRADREKIETIVNEDGAMYCVELAQKMDTGLFLDNCRARELIKELSFGKSVLNLFSYTGAYGVSAARGGAIRVVNVDTSSSALEVAKKNMELNGFLGPLFEEIKSDVKEYISSCQPSAFDIIIFDCPVFSNAHGGRREEWDVQKDHAKVLNDCKRLLKKDGIILFRTSLSTFRLDSKNLSDFKTYNYTSEMQSPGFTRKSQKITTYVLRPYFRKYKQFDNQSAQDYKKGGVSRNGRIFKKNK